MFWRIIYNILIVPAVKILIPVIGLFDRKMRRGIEGRKDLFEKFQREISRLDSRKRDNGNPPRVWFHSSSMGEFEQAKPIIAELRKRWANIEIIVSFFSPSGYDHSRSYRHADIITYIPFDTPADAKKFIEIMKPTVAIMVRYDVWPNHIWTLHEMRVPTFIANATLSETTTRALPLLKQFHYGLYNAIDYILTVSESDVKMFESFRLDHSIVKSIGDTRYDQVLQRSADAKSRHILPAAVYSGKQALVIGSSWEDDENVLLPVVQRLIDEHPNLVVILAPHEPNEENLERIEKTMNGRTPTLRFSLIVDHKDERFILVDSIGILMTLYRYADIAFVGGSFKQGVHNVLEPAVYGVPVIVGPKHENSHEAVKLKELGALFVGTNELDLYGTIRSLLENDLKRTDAGKKALDYVCTNAGATERFLSYLEKVLETKESHHSSV
ncbi:MAG: 3-deoxy-D-manno-octulosonic acid transferase [Bacteroidota bacterium]